MPVILLLNHPNTTIQEQASVCLRNLSLSCGSLADMFDAAAENEAAIVSEGGLPPVVGLLHGTDTLIEQALVVLRNISVNR